MLSLHASRWWQTWLRRRCNSCSAARPARPGPLPSDGALAKDDTVTAEKIIAGGTNFAVYRDFNPPGGPRTNNGGAVTTTTTNGPIFKAAPQVWGNDFFFTIRLMPIR